MPAKKPAKKPVKTSAKKPAKKLPAPRIPVLAENQLTTPGRYNFVQASTYRLKMSNVPGRCCGS